VPRNSHGPAPRGAAVEVARLIRRIQALKAELDSAERRRRAEPEQEAKERDLERLRWRLAAAARRAASQAR
jgi:hypothetical protein